MSISIYFIFDKIIKIKINEEVYNQIVYIDGHTITITIRLHLTRMKNNNY